ncbi:hypothetical protein [Mycobacterium sp. MMS18-G62]
MNTTHSRRLVPAAFIAAGAITGLMAIAAPAAHAELPSQVEAQCHGLGGTWTSSELGGEILYSCCYKPLAGSGAQTCDYYASDGSFIGSDEGDSTKPTLPPARPGQFRPTLPPAQTVH